MIKLLRYEIQRKWKLSLGLLGMFAIIYFGFLIKFNHDIQAAVAGMNLQSFDMDVVISAFGFRIIFFIILASGLFFAGIISAINNLRLEVKQPSRDLYFSIPMTAYTKVGSKVIVSVVEVALAGIIGFASVIFALEFLTKLDIWPLVFKAFKELPADLLLYGFLGNLVEGIMMLLVVYLSFAIFRSFFSQMRFGGIITLVIYVILNYFIIKLFGTVIMQLDNSTFTDTTMWLLLGGFTLFTAGLFLLIGFLFEKRVSFD